MRNLSKFFTWAGALLLIGSVWSVSAQDVESTPDMTIETSALLRMLGRVPDVPGNVSEVYFNDRRAVEIAYPPARMPVSYLEFQTMSEASGRDRTYSELDLWWLVWRNGSTSIMSQNLGFAEDMSAAVGFDFFDVERELRYGAPPYTGTIVEGQFDPAAVRAVFEAQDYDVLDTIAGFELLCPTAGCDTGINQNLSLINRANPFGGDLGRQQPLLVSENTIISSTVLDSAIAVAQGNRPSLAESASYAGAVEAVEAEGVLLQAYFWDSDLIQRLADPFDPALLLAGNGIEDVQAQLQAQLEDFEELPAFTLLMFADVATEAEQVGLVALVYTNEEDAQTAADLIPRRIDEYTSVAVRQPLRDLLEERYVELVQTEVVNAGERFVTLVRFATPKATPEQITLFSPTNADPPNVAPPGTIFRFLTSSAQRLDLGWLSTATREQLEFLSGE